MTCTDFDIRDYFLGELPEKDRPPAARHLASCSWCASELESLKHLRIALESLPDQEPPQRIGFVSDKVFGPSGWRRI
jgi:anti-sigma factor RsiW